MSFHFFELKKLPDELNADNMLLLWLALFKAETKEEFTRIESLEVPVMKQAINAYQSITATAEFRETSNEIVNSVQSMYAKYDRNIKNKRFFSTMH
jgi:hypothetical protein